MDQTLELKTTTNQAERRIIIQFMTNSNERHNVLVFKCTNIYHSTWIYALLNCMADSWTPYNYMTGVPTDQTKVWQITRTRTSLLVRCNGVTVLDFNFAVDYKSGYSSCLSLWNRPSTAIQFYHSDSLYGNNGHLSMRTLPQCKCLASLIWQSELYIRNNLAFTKSLACERLGT